MTTRVLFVVASLLVLVACSDGSGTGTSSVIPATINESSLVGRWESINCGADGSGFSENIALVFNADFTGERILSTFADSRCAEPGFTVRVPNTYLEGRNTELPGRGIQTELDIFPGVPTLLIESQDAANAFNAEPFCNFTEWQINVTYSIEGCAIGRIEAVVPQAQFTVYLVEDNQFLYGGTELSFTADNRPTFVGSNPAFRRAGTENSTLSVFPPDVLGLWVLGNSTFYLDFAENGVWTSYSQEADATCHDVTEIPLAALGNNQYENSVGLVVDIVPANGTLNFSFESSPTVFNLVPADRRDLASLVLCSDL